MLFSTKNIFTFFLTLLILFFLLDRLNFKLIKLFQYINKLLKKINFIYRLRFLLLNKIKI